MYKLGKNGVPGLPMMRSISMSLSDYICDYISVSIYRYEYVYSGYSTHMSNSQNLVLCKVTLGVYWELFLAPMYNDHYRRPIYGISISV